MELEKLSLQILYIIASSSLLRHPSRVSFSKINTIKNELIQYVSLDNPSIVINAIHTHAKNHKSPQKQSDIHSTPTTPTSKYTNNTTPIVTLSQVREYVEIFPQINQSFLSAANAALSSENTPDGLSRRFIEINDMLYMSDYERMELAVLIIKIYDQDYRYHCNRTTTTTISISSTGEGGVEGAVRGEGSGDDSVCTESNCEYTPHQCTNTGCNIHISKKWITLHDETCAYKLIPCQRLCGESVARRMLITHMNTSCELKPVICPFKDIGCIAGKRGHNSDPFLCLTV